ncbi:hypothetical protein QYF36_011423 [Acer negundo]|nr:hypothetical protein QYF36_011423 [Acer negundo]
MISAKTIYGAYLIVKFADRAYGLDSLPSEVSLEIDSFSIEKSTCKKLSMLILQENFQLHGREILSTGPGKRKPLLQSRFAEVVELRTITWLEIHGKINTNMISAKTVYVVYLIVKFADRACAYGLDLLPSEVSLEVGDVKS